VLIRARRTADQVIVRWIKDYGKDGEITHEETRVMSDQDGARVP